MGSAFSRFSINPSRPFLLRSPYGSLLSLVGTLILYKYGTVHARYSVTVFKWVSLSLTAKSKWRVSVLFNSEPTLAHLFGT